MNESVLMKISVICSVAGLITLFYLSVYVESSIIQIEKITPEDIGIVIKVCGTVDYKYVSKNRHIFMKIRDESSTIKVVVFNNTVSRMALNPYEIEENDFVCVTGKIDIYENEIEILAKNFE